MYKNNSTKERASALPGVFNSYRQPKDQWGQNIVHPYLTSQLQAFASRNRKIIFCIIKLTARNNCFDKIQSILVNTNIEKPPNDVLADILDGFSYFC